MAATLDHDEEGNLVRKAGVMGVVVSGGEVRPGDAIRVELRPRRTGPLSRFETIGNLSAGSMTIITVS